MYCTPVLGANIGGIPELIRVGETGELFESGNKKDLLKKLNQMWINREQNQRDMQTKEMPQFDSISKYCQWLVSQYAAE